VQREDDFALRRRQVAELSDAELEQRFWELTERVVEPLVELARGHTSPSIERSVLMRMGFSGFEARAIVDGCTEHHLLGKGAGHVVWKLATSRGMGIIEAGRALTDGRHWDEAVRLFPAAGR